MQSATTRRPTMLTTIHSRYMMRMAVALARTASLTSQMGQGAVPFMLVLFPNQLSAISANLPSVVARRRMHTRRSGRVDALLCEVSGIPWAEHLASGSKHCLAQGLASAGSEAAGQAGARGRGTCRRYSVEGAVYYGNSGRGIYVGIWSSIWEEL